MSEKNSDKMKKMPSECSSPASREKVDNDSSRMSGFPSHWDFEESCITFDHLNRSGRIRQSSWDNSDNDLPLRLEKSPESSHLYSDDTQFQGSVTLEINELKKQFFETLEKVRDENGTEEQENLRDKVESKLNSDRRQSPARMRRRTKSSSSSSPILESKSHNSPEKIEKLNDPEAILEEISTKALEFDSKFYLNKFFTEIRSRRISMMDTTTENGSVEDPPDYESENIQIPNEIKGPDSNENDYFCKTLRKLSKILEVEESKTDLEKSSEEKMDNSGLFSKTLKNLEENISPLQTARSKKSQGIPESIRESKSKKEEKYKSLSYEEFGNFHKVEKSLRGSFSERTSLIFNHKINDNFISLTAKSEKVQVDPPNDKKSFLNSINTNEDFSKEPNFKDEEKGKNFDSHECLNIDLTKDFTVENSTPKKSTDRSERTHSSRTMSAKSGRRINPDSPVFTINLGKDSERSLRIEDISTPHSLRKDSVVKTPSELKASSLEDCSPATATSKKCSSNRTEDTFESKTEKNLQKSQKSSSLESVKSSYRSSKEQDINYLISYRSNQSSQRKKQKHRQVNQNIDFKTNESNFTFTVEKVDSSSSVESSSSVNLHNKSSKSGSFKKITDEDISNGFENQSKYSRSPKSYKRSDLRAEENDQLYDQETLKNNNILELDLPLEMSERLESGKDSYRCVKTEELNVISKDNNPSETNLLKHTNHRVSERSLSSRSRNLESRRSTPRSLKIISRTNSSSSSRSKNSLENCDNTENTESFLNVSWKELEKICDTVNNHTSVSSASSRSSRRELETPNQRNSYRKKLFSPEQDSSDIIITPKNNDTLKEQLSRSRSSRRSANSQVVDLSENNNSDRSIKTKSKPTSWNPEEHKSLNVLYGIEKLNLDAINDKTIDRFFTFKEDEEKSSPIQKSENRTESYRNSDKKFSAINEVSFENLKTSIENKEENVCEQSGESSKKSNKQFSPQSEQKAPKRSGKSLKENSLDELSSEINNPDDGKWNELIGKFCKNLNSSNALENTFPSFFHKEENLFNSARDTTLKENSANNGYSENPLDFSTLSKRSENEYGSFENNSSFKRVFEDKEASNIEFKESLLKKDLEEKDIQSMRKSQNLFYCNLNKERPFGIGEFGDVTCWNACKSDTIDFEKPKDHGDGTQTQKTSEVLILPEKRMNETKTQRNLWTELRKDFRDSKEPLNKLFPETDDHIDFIHYIPIGLKTSKSDNCIKSKSNAGSDFQTPPSCKFLLERNGTPKNTENKFLEFENIKKENKELNSTSESVTEKHLSVESLEFEKDSENQEFECEITPRLSTSMSNFETQFQEDSFTNRESNESLNTSRTQLFEEKTDTKYENEMTDLNIFLAPNEKKNKIKSNWLTLKNPEKEKSCEQDKKTKRKKKNTSSSKEPFHEYLYSRKSRSNVPQLKVRNSSCFQNFYKRFISVFCLTSHSSSATSKCSASF